MNEQTTDNEKPIHEEPKKVKQKLPLWWGFLVPVFVIILINTFRDCLSGEMSWRIWSILAMIFVSFLFPWKLRRWMWVAGGAVLLSALAWLLIPEASDGKWTVHTSQAHAESMSLTVQPVDPDDAGPIYEKLLQQREWKSILQQMRAMDPNDISVMKPQKLQNNAKLNTLLDGLQPELEMLLEAASKPICTFNYEPTLEGERQASQNSYGLLVMAKLLILDARRDAANNLHNDAIQKLEAIIQMGKHFCQQTPFLYFGMGLACKGRAYYEIRIIVLMENVPVEVSDRFEDYLNRDNFDLDSKWPEHFRLQKLYEVDIDSRNFLVNESGNFRFNPFVLIDALDKMEKSGWNNMSAYTNGFQSRIGILAGWLVSAPDLPTVLQMVEEAYNDPDVSSYEIKDKVSLLAYKQSLKKSLDISVKFQHDFHLQFKNTVKIHETRINGCKLICDIKRYKEEYGRLPDSLNDLVLSKPELLIDPSNNQPFVYRLEDNDFKLYSTGVNGIDESGKSKRKREIADYKTGDGYDKLKEYMTDEYDDIMIWPPKKPKKTRALDVLLR